MAERRDLVLAQLLGMDEANPFDVNELFIRWHCHQLCRTHLGLTAKIIGQAALVTVAHIDAVAALN